MAFRTDLTALQVAVLIGAGVIRNGGSPDDGNDLILVMSGITTTTTLGTVIGTVYESAPADTATISLPAIATSAALGSTIATINFGA